VLARRVWTLRPRVALREPEEAAAPRAALLPVLLPGDESPVLAAFPHAGPQPRGLRPASARDHATRALCPRVPGGRLAPPGPPAWAPAPARAPASLRAGPVVQGAPAARPR